MYVCVHMYMMVRLHFYLQINLALTKIVWFTEAYGHLSCINNKKKYVLRKSNTSSSVLSPEKAMAPHSSTLAWRIPGTAEPGGLPSIGSHRADPTEEAT